MRTLLSSRGSFARLVLVAAHPLRCLCKVGDARQRHDVVRIDGPSWTGVDGQPVAVGDGGAVLGHQLGSDVSTVIVVGQPEGLDVVVDGKVADVELTADFDLRGDVVPGPFGELMCSFRYPTGPNMGPGERDRFWSLGGLGLVGFEVVGCGAGRLGCFNRATHRFVWGFSCCCLLGWRCWWSGCLSRSYVRTLGVAYMV